MATPSNYQGVIHDRGSSSGTTDVQTLDKPKSAQAMILAVETTNARVVLDGTTPDSTNGIVVAKDSAPLYLPVAEDIKWVATSGAASVVNVVWLL